MEECMELVEKEKWYEIKRIHKKNMKGKKKRKRRKEIK